MKQPLTNEMQGELLGKIYTPELVQNIDFGSVYPVLNRETHCIIGFVDRKYPDELNAGLWDTGALVDGEIKTGDAYCDFAVKRPSLTDEMFMSVLDRVGELEKH